MLTYGSSKAASGRCHPIERSAFFLPGLLLAFADCCGRLHYLERRAFFFLPRLSVPSSVSDRPPEAVPARSVPDTL